MTLGPGQSLEQDNTSSHPTHKAELRIQTGEQITTLRVDDFNALFSDIARFNDQFSMGSMIC